MEEPCFHICEYFCLRNPLPPIGRKQCSGLALRLPERHGPPVRNEPHGARLSLKDSQTKMAEPTHTQGFSGVLLERPGEGKEEMERECQREKGLKTGPSSGAVSGGGRESRCVSTERWAPEAWGPRTSLVRVWGGDGVSREFGRPSTSLRHKQRDLFQSACLSLVIHFPVK